jgi:tetratricopeptide (TPR) repeat protein
VSKIKIHKKDKNERREELLHPSRYLGYDHDELGMYLFSRGSYKISENQFRRAVWLNPFESSFKEHTALCLYKLGRYLEAFDYLKQVPENPENRNLMEQKKNLLKLIRGNNVQENRYINPNIWYQNYCGCLFFRGVHSGDVQDVLDARTVCSRYSGICIKSEGSSMEGNCGRDRCWCMDLRWRYRLCFQNARGAVCSSLSRSYNHLCSGACLGAPGLLVSYW